MWAQTNKSRAQERYEEFQRKTRQRYESFMKDVNDRYAAMMERVWERYYASRPEERPVFDEPPTPVVDNNPEQPVVPRPVPIKDVVDEPQPSPVQPQPLEPLPTKPQPAEHPIISFDYFGTLQAVYKPKMPVLSSLRERDVAQAWKQIGNSEENVGMLSDMLELRKKLSLCDWAYMQLIDKALEATNASKDSRTLMHAWLLSLIHI